MALIKVTPITLQPFSQRIAQLNVPAIFAWCLLFSALQRSCGKLLMVVIKGLAQSVDDDI